MKRMIVGAILMIVSIARAETHRVSQAVDANILPAMTVDVADVVVPAGRWTSTGNDLVADGPTARLQSNVEFVMRSETRVIGSSNVDVRVGDFGAPVRGAAAKAVVVPSVIDRILDFGRPSGDPMTIEVGYTILPAGV